MTSDGRRDIETMAFESSATVRGVPGRSVRLQALAAMRHKGKGVQRPTLKLMAAGLAAVRRLAELDCWGPFSSSSMIKSFHKPCDAEGAPCPGL